MADDPERTKVHLVHTRADDFRTYYATGTIIGMTGGQVSGAITKMHLVWYTDSIGSIAEDLEVSPMDPATGAAKVLSNSLITPSEREDHAE